MYEFCFCKLFFYSLINFKNLGLVNYKGAQNIRLWIFEYVALPIQMYQLVVKSKIEYFYHQTV